MSEFDIVLVANSPGELSALVRPIAKQFKDKLPSSRVILVITPCQYSSGNEVEFAKKNLATDIIISSDEYKKWLLGSSLPNNFEFKPKGIVLFLGGDLLHATLIAKKLGYKAFAYLANKGVSWISVFEKFFVPKSSLFAKKIPAAKLVEVGDLMSEPLPTLSKIDAQKKWQLDPSRKTIAMMPGSRLWEIRHLLPIYGKIVERLKQEDASLQFILIISPFTPISDIEAFKESSLFDVFTPFESITAADLVVTIPGTNTAQVAALGLPMIVLFPLDKPESIPMEGLANYLGAIPVLGNIIKRIIANLVNKATKYFALPNIKANREIIPEIRGKISIKEASDKILGMVHDDFYLGETSQILKHLMAQANASEKIVEAIINETIFKAS